MAKTVIWNRDEQEFVHASGRTLVFASTTDANTYLARGAVKRQDEKSTKPKTGVTTTTFDLVTVN